MPAISILLIDPYDREETVERAKRELEKIEVPAYTGSGWYGYTYKTHLHRGAELVSPPQRLRRS